MRKYTDAVCSKCRKRKPKTEFFVNEKRHTKVQPYCKECEKGRYVEKRDYHLRYEKEYAKKNGFRLKAQKLARLHVKKQPCEVCGSEKSVAHHPDYTKPLDVMWLCRKHHVQWHKENEPIYPTPSH